MKEPLFSGACTALVTPFGDSGVNYPMFEKLLQRQCDAGIEAIVISGTTGESPTLSDNEKLSMFQFAKSCVGSACKIIAGTGSNSTARTVQLSVSAQEVGIDALLIVTPYYNKATASGLYAHYEAVAQAVDIPIITYNVPSRTSVDISPAVYTRIAQLPNIIGTKEASADITKITKIRCCCGNHFTIWSGNDDMTVPAIALGAKGVISVLSNLFPAETQTLCRAALNGDFTTACALQMKFQPLIDLLFCEVNPIPVKEAMRILGFDCGPCRLPLTPMSEENRKRLVKVLDI